MMSPLQKAHALTQKRKAATIFDLLQKNSNQFHPSQSLIFCRAIFIARPPAATEPGCHCEAAFFRRSNPRAHGEIASSSLRSSSQ
jgi:hypothetical protein